MSPCVCLKRICNCSLIPSANSQEGSAINVLGALVLRGDPQIKASMFSLSAVHAITGPLPKIFSSSLRKRGFPTIRSSSQLNAALRFVSASR